MKRLHASLQMPLAITFASLFSLLLFVLAAQPQLDLRLARHRQLTSEVSQRQKSRDLQHYAILTEKLQTPLASEKDIIAVLRAQFGSKQLKSIKFSFGPAQSQPVGSLGTSVRPLTVTLTGQQMGDVNAFIENFSRELPNHALLKSYSYEQNPAQPALASARTEFEIYGIAP